MNTSTLNAETKPRIRLRKASEYLNLRRQFAPVRMLFDEFWREGELALMFGASGTGKSVLAMQVGDAIARGRPLDGFMMPTGRRRVLYVDLDTSDKHFEMRYLQTREGAKQYHLSDNLLRERPPEGKELDEWLREVVAECRIQVVIVDSLSAIKRTHDGTRETLGVMRKLKRLCDELDISILVVTDSLQWRRNAAVAEADLGRSRILCTVADAAFGIGRADCGARYLMQTRARNSEIFWTERNAPRANIEMLESGLLGFRFDERFAPELDEEKRRLICRVRQMRAAGEPYRVIAAELKISKSHAGRLYAQWTPAMGCGQLCGDCSETHGELVPAAAGPSETAGADAVQIESSFPKEAYRGEFTDNYLVSIGMRRVWKEKLEAARRASGSELSDACFPENPVDVAPEPDDGMPTEAEIEFSKSCGIPERIARLKRGLDGYKREIFIESEADNGQPRVWYKRSRQGLIFRSTRNSNGIYGERVDVDDGHEVANDS